MSIWKIKLTDKILNERGKNTLNEALGIEFMEIGDSYIKARMPVDSRTIQPAGRLHGGASVALAETLGSVASFMCLDVDKERPVGMEINANHLRAIKSGFVYGTVTPIHIGRKSHVWEIKITSEEGKLITISRITLAIIKTEEI